MVSLRGVGFLVVGVVFLVMMGIIGVWVLIVEGVIVFVFDVLGMWGDGDEDLDCLIYGMFCFLYNFLLVLDG